MLSFFKILSFFFESFIFCISLFDFVSLCFFFVCLFFYTIQCRLVAFEETQDFTLFLKAKIFLCSLIQDERWLLAHNQFTLMTSPFLFYDVISRSVCTILHYATMHKEVRQCLIMS